MRNLLIASALVLGSLMTQAQTSVTVTSVTINVNHNSYTPPTYTPPTRVRYSSYQAKLAHEKNVKEAQMARQAEIEYKEDVKNGLVVPRLDYYILLYIQKHTPKLFNLYDY